LTKDKTRINIIQHGPILSTMMCLRTCPQKQTSHEKPKTLFFSFHFFIIASSSLQKHPKK